MKVTFKAWKVSGHTMGDKWKVKISTLMSHPGGRNAECLGVKEESYWDLFEVDKYICSILHN